VGGVVGAGVGGVGSGGSGVLRGWLLGVAWVKGHVMTATSV
jgi:hypothetical protein